MSLRESVDTSYSRELAKREQLFKEAAALKTLVRRDVGAAWEILKLMELTFPKKQIK